MKFLFVFLYIFNDQPILEKSLHETSADCQRSGYERVEKVMADPAALFAFAGCTPVKALSAQKEQK